MDVFYGIGVSPGIVIGPVFVLDDEHRRIPRRSIKPDSVESELTRLDEAIEASVAELDRMQSEMERQVGADAAKVFGFHMGMLRDQAILGPMRSLIREESVTAEYAAHHTFGEWTERFARMPDPAFRTKASDLNDLAGRLIANLVGERSSRLEALDHPSVVVSPELTPSQTVGFDRSKVRAIATDFGGRTSHTSIVARALGIPAVVGTGRLSPHVQDDTPVIVDGDRGVVIVDPDRETIEEYERLEKQRSEIQLGLRDLAELESVTADGQRISLMGNIEFADEINAVFENGGDGVGLYRTEFLYLARETEPTEEDHFRSYRRCVELLEGKPLVIRTVDLGADKYTRAFLEEAEERNPFLGLRSIRYCLKNLPMFKRQLRAILRASALGPIKIMFPLVSSMSELRQAKYLIRDVMEDLQEDQVPFDPAIEVGIMVEVPATALMSSTFAREVDFFSIGTNDLVQYTIAVDRTNERVASLYNPHHPAVLKLIRDVIRSGRRRSLDVSCCGESAGDPGFALLLIGLGLRTLSVTPSSMPELKRLVRGVTIPQCERIARRVMSFDSDTEVANYLREQLRKLMPDSYDTGKA